MVEAFEIAGQMTEIPAPRRLPAGLFRVLAGLISREVERFITLPRDYSSEFLRLSAGVTYLGSNRKAREQLSYAPRSLEDGLRETLPAEMRAPGLPPPAPTSPAPMPSAHP